MRDRKATTIQNAKKIAQATNHKISTFLYLPSKLRQKILYHNCSLEMAIKQPHYSASIVAIVDLHCRWTKYAGEEEKERASSWKMVLLNALPEIAKDIVWVENEWTKRLMRW